VNLKELKMKNKFPLSILIVSMLVLLVGCSAGTDSLLPQVTTTTVVKGTQGIQGIQGVKGDKGDKGDTGAQGLQGLQGMDGQQGSQGIQGIQGIKGDTGLQGAKGDKGDKGDIGATGLNGANGFTGMQGIQGTKGDTGLQGVQGIKGDTGLQGIPGQNLIVAMGYVWFNSDLSPELVSEYNVENITLNGYEYQISIKNIDFYLSEYVVMISLVAGNAISYSVGKTTDNKISIWFFLPTYYLDDIYIKNSGTQYIIPECFQFVVFKYPTTN
jgi:hypothetical protein